MFTEIFAKMLAILLIFFMILKKIFLWLWPILQIVVLILYTMVLPELSLPWWIKKVRVVWWEAALIVSILSLPVLLACFWPKYFLKILSQKKRDKVKSFFIKIMAGLKSKSQIAVEYLRKSMKFLLEKSETEPEKINYPDSFSNLFFGLLVLLFIILAKFVRTHLIKIKKWFSAGHEKFYRRLKVILYGLGYLGVIIGAGVPYIPGFRQAGVATVIIMGKRQAKILFLLVELVRIWVEAYLLSKV